MSNKLRVFTWHVHGNYLYYLSQTNVDFVIPFNKNRTPGYSGKTNTFPWGKNVHEIPVEQVKDTAFDCILYQHKSHYLVDQYNILSPQQRTLPKIYLEHDPPQEHPTNTKHYVTDTDVLLIHVTHFNNLMWDSQQTPTTVIPHGVLVPNTVSYTGEIKKGIVVVNNLRKRGRRLGLDIFETVREQVPLDLVGMDSESLGGLGEIRPTELPEFISHYRFFFNPIRYTSLGLSVLEAMMVGLPIIGLSTTEMATTIENGKSGYIHTDIEVLIKKMHFLLENQQAAIALSLDAKATAQRQFTIVQFTRAWEKIFFSYKDVTAFS